MLATFTLAAVAPLSPPQFGTPTEITRRFPGASALVFGDFDGDSHVDIVGGSSVDGALRFWKADGVGGFQAGEDLPLVLGPVRSMSVGDLDGDGDLDLAIATPGPTVVWVENLGGGEFAGEIPLAGFGAVLPGSIVRQRIVDFDGNGTMDVLMTFDRSSSSQESLVLLAGSTGGGQFTAQTLITSPTALFDAEAADLDGDGDQDIVVGGSGVGAWYRNDGAGVMFGPISLPLPSGAADEQVAAADVDGDGNLDLVSLQCTSASVGTAVYVSRGDGAGSFTQQGPVALFSCISNVVIQDLNGDGRSDLLAAAEGSSVGRVELALGTAAGSFSAPRVLVEGELPFSAVGVGDADGDGTLEVASGTGSGQVLVEEFVPGSQPLTLADDGVELTQTVSATFRDRLLGTIDLNGDGREDVLALAAVEERIAWWPADGRGGFGALRTIERIAPFPQEVYVADIDGDGVQDIVRRVFRTGRYLWLRGDGAGGFAAPAALSVPPIFFPANEVVDVDGDGRADFVYWQSAAAGQFAWARNLGGGLFGPRTELPFGPGFFRAPRLQDVNGDGLLDVGFLGASITLPLAQFAYFPATAPGVFASTPTYVDLFSPFIFGAGSDWSVADFDGDGEQDLVVSANALMAPARNRLQLYRGLGGGQFSGVSVLAGTPQAAIGLQVADIDGDGRPDIAQIVPVATGLEGGLGWHRNLNGTQFAARQVVVPTQAGLSGFLLGDFDGDGDVDTVFAESANDAIVRVETLYRGEVGVPYCSAAVANSSGEIGDMSASGSALPGAGDLTLRASRLPLQSFGFFLGGQTPSAVGVANSVGILCLGGDIGRFTGPGQVVSSGMTGSFSIAAMPGSLPTPQGPAAALAGETWYFQAWHRDTVNGQATSNFTRAVSVRFL